MRTTLAALTLLALAPAVRADVAAPPPVLNRIAPAEVIVAGRVSAIEDKDVEAPHSPGAAQKAKYRVAIVTISDPILGAKGLKTVRVGFFPVGGPNAGRRPWQYTSQLKAGEEVTLLLRKHHSGDFYFAPAYWDVLRSEAPNYAKETAEIRRYAKYLADVPAGLKSKNASDRFLTAALAILKHRTRGPGQNAQEPIDAAQSKQLLKALHGADWSGVIKGVQPNPFTVFNQLGLTAKDGWQPPAGAKGLQEYVDAARAWLQKNSDTYRIQRFVSNAK